MLTKNSPTAKHSNKIDVTKNEPCLHCGKEDWCYRFSDSPLEVCNRSDLWASGEPAKGYYKTSKHDSKGHYYLAPVDQQKPLRPKQITEWHYEDRNGNPLVRVVRQDDGNGKRKFYQQHDEGGRWVTGRGNVKREDIPVYRYRQVQQAKLLGYDIFIVEGEKCAEALCKLDLFATTNIGGAGEWKDSDSADVVGAKLILCPDMDKPGVKRFLDLHKRHPDAKVLLPYPDSPLWDNLPESGGLDVHDSIKEYHLNADDILSQIMDITPELIQKLERQLRSVHSSDVAEDEGNFASSNNRASKIPKADVLAVEMAEGYQDKLLYNNENGCWMFYGLEQYGVWEVITNDVAESIISKELDSRGITGYGGHNYVINILKKLKCILIQCRWNEALPTEYLPFQDKVLELATGKVIEHSPGFRFTWSLPRNYDENAQDWSLIEAWIDEVTGGKQDLKNIILCYCNAVLRGRCELQKVLLVTGHGGTGKTILQNLVVELIGIRNTHVTSLPDFCGNRFETANAYGKRLTIFPDEDKYAGGLQRFKDLTGGGWLRVERKGKDVERKFKYTGMVMMASNFSIFVGEQSSAIKRRIITVPFIQTPKGIDIKLFENLTSQLNGFTNYLLSLSDEFVTNTLLGTQESAEINSMDWEQRIMTDSVAWWLNDFLIRDENARTPIGNNKNEAQDGGLGNVITLFGSYHQRCLDAGKSPVANTALKARLLDLCNNILGWKEIVSKNTKYNNGIQGLCLRKIGEHDHIPTLEQQFAEEIEGLCSTLSTIESQQAFECSTSLSTNAPPDAPPHLVEMNHQLSTNIYKGGASGGASGGALVEHQVEHSNHYCITEVERVEHEGGIPCQIFNEGERVKIDKPESPYHRLEVVVANTTSSMWVKVLFLGNLPKGVKKSKSQSFHYRELERVNNKANTHENTA